MKQPITQMRAHLRAIVGVTDETIKLLLIQIERDLADSRLRRTGYPAGIIDPEFNPFELFESLEAQLRVIKSILNKRNSELSDKAMIILQRLWRLKNAYLNPCA